MTSEPSGMMDGVGGLMMGGMGPVWLLLILVLVLGVAALIKYLVSNTRRRNGSD
jgi:hypothetical protein